MCIYGSAYVNVHNIYRRRSTSINVHLPKRTFMEKASIDEHLQKCFHKCEFMEAHIYESSSFINT